MSDYLKEGFIDEVKGCLGGRGGQENVIESIKVNGVGQTVDENKAVNIPVPTKTSDLDNDSGYQTNSEVSSTVAAEVAKIVADAPEDFDTLKEMSDWISQHEDSAAAMNSAILKNKEDISSLYTSKADVSDVQTVEASVDELNSNLDALEYSEIAGGKNLFKYNEVSGTLSKTVECSLDAGTYTISALVNSSDTDSSTSLINFYYEDGNSESYLLGRESRTSCTVTLTKHVIALIFHASKDYVNSANDTFTYSDIQIEKGTTATPYEPYIPSVKMLADEVSAQNDSLADYGLDNKCNSLEQGYATWWDANVEQSPDYIHTDFISVSNGDLITIKGGLNASHVIFYNASKEFISFKTDVNKVFVPSGVAFVRANFYGSGITPINVNIGIYVENQIDVIKNDLIVLETTSTIEMTASRELDDITSTALTIPSGYKPIAMYGYNKDNNDNVSAIPLLVRSDGKVLFHAKNHSTSDQGIIHFAIRVTFKKFS